MGVFCVGGVRVRAGRSLGLPWLALAWPAVRGRPFACPGWLMGRGLPLEVPSYSDGAGPAVKLL